MRSGGQAKSWLADRERFQRLAERGCRYAQVTTKHHWGWRWVAIALGVLSAGRLSREDFLCRFATTLGPLQAYPAEWEELSLAIIAHESRHTQQFLWAGWFVPVVGWLHPTLRVWAGILPMAVVYGCFPLPLFFAWGRFRLELDAEAYAWQIGLAEGWLSAAEVRSRAAWHADRVAGWSYLRAWPRGWTRQAFERRAEYEINRVAS